VFLIVVVVVGLLAVRYPIVNQLAGWLLVFPLVTLAGGTIAWAIVIQRSAALFSFGGWAMTLALFAVPVALWVTRLNRS
jgi:hypothetical protein